MGKAIEKIVRGANDALFSREQTSNSLIGKKVRRGDEIYTIHAIHLLPHLLPGLKNSQGRNNQSYGPAIVFEDKDGKHRWGNLPLTSSSKEIVDAIGKHGFELVEEAKLNLNFVRAFLSLFGRE